MGMEENKHHLITLIDKLIHTVDEYSFCSSFSICFA